MFEQEIKRNWTMCNELNEIRPSPTQGVRLNRVSGAFLLLIGGLFVAALAQLMEKLCHKPDIIIISF